MRLSVLTAVLAASITASPVLAQSAAPLSFVSASRVGASISGANNIDDDNMLLPAAIVFGVLAAAILWTSSKDDDDFGNPVSP
jgi:hypothetical protein